MPVERISGPVKLPDDIEFENTKPHIPIKSLGTLKLDGQGRITVIGGFGELTGGATITFGLTEVPVPPGTAGASSGMARACPLPANSRFSTAMKWLLPDPKDP